MDIDPYMGIPLWDPKGRPIGLIAIMGNNPFKDVDLAKSALQKVALKTYHEVTVREWTKDLQDANRRLEDANSDIISINDNLHAMVEIIYHDVINQLTVLTCSLLLLKNQPLDEKAKEWLSRLERPINVISGTLVLSKDYARVAIKEPEWQQLTPIIERSSNPRIPIRSDVNVLSIFADPLFPKAFFNLMYNADKHENIVNHISVRQCSMGDVLKHIWGDNGEGISADKKESIFKRGSTD